MVLLECAGHVEIFPLSCVKSNMFALCGADGLVSNEGTFKRSIPVYVYVE